MHVLGRLFRRLFLQELENAFNAGKLRFFTNLANLAEPQAFARRLGELRRLDWVVYAKPPFGGPEQVLAYLGRYTHRVAIANSRLLSLADGKVRFTWIPTGRQDQGDDTRGGRVHSPFSATRSARRLPSYPPLRFPRQ